MVTYENESLPDDQELDERIDREEYCIVNFYMKMVVLLVKPTITIHLLCIMFHGDDRRLHLLEDIDGAEVLLLWNKYITFRLQHIVCSC